MTSLLFETGLTWGYDNDGRTGQIRCRLCGRRFARWNGTANHGFMHEKRGEAIARTERSAQGYRYVFWLPPVVREGEPME